MKRTSLIWIMKTGEKILVKDMTDSHVFNCICALKQRKIYPLRDTKRNKWLNIFILELRKRKYNRLDL